MRPRWCIPISSRAAAARSAAGPPLHTPHVQRSPENRAAAAVLSSACATARLGPAPSRHPQARCARLHLGCGERYLHRPTPPQKSRQCFALSCFLHGEDAAPPRFRHRSLFLKGCRKTPGFVKVFHQPFKVGWGPLQIRAAEAMVASSRWREAWGRYLAGKATNSVAVQPRPLDRRERP